MEEEAPSRRSVAELAGRFKSSTCQHDAAENETKPVRRRPPRSLQLTKPQGDDEEPPGVTSPLPAKAKRNSALIEKLQANLALSPTTLLPSPKSPGFKLLPPAFTPPSPGSAPVSGIFSGTLPPAGPLITAGASPVTEEGPASFEAPPTLEEGAILSNTSIKERARHSIRRRPPSRRHRKSSSGDDAGLAAEGGEASTSAPTEPEDEPTGDRTHEVEEDKTDASTCLQKNKEEDESEMSVETGGDETKEGSMGGEKGEGSSSGRKEEEEEEEEKNTGEKQSTESKEEKREETTGQTSAR